MRSLFGILYAFLFLAYLSGGIFIVYHFFRYSPSKASATIGVTIFLSVFLVLLFTNAMLFFMLPLDSFFPGIDMPSLDFTSGSTGFGPFAR
jgi:hypothetical protein